MKVTDKELAYLQAIVDSEYQGGETPVRYKIWDWSPVDQLPGPRKKWPGVAASLNKKGLIVSEETGWEAPQDATVYITQAGYDVLMKSKRGAKESTWRQEAEAEKTEYDLPLVGNFEPGDEVTVSGKWKQHWSYKNAPAPTKRLWNALIGTTNTVTGIDQHGNVWLTDNRWLSPDGFPVPARFVRRAGVSR